MKTIIAALMLMASAGAGWAAEPVARSFPLPPPTYTLTVTAQDVGVIGLALRDRPYREVVALLASLQAQIDAQDRARTPVSGKED